MGGRHPAKASDAKLTGFNVSGLMVGSQRFQAFGNYRLFRISLP